MSGAEADPSDRWPRTPAVHFVQSASVPEEIILRSPESPSNGNPRLPAVEVIQLTDARRSDSPVSMRRPVPQSMPELPIISTTAPTPPKRLNESLPEAAPHYQRYEPKRRDTVLLTPDTTITANSSRASTVEAPNIWKLVLDQATLRDEDLVDGWERSMDVLLVFAALFAAILTAFLVESYKLLQDDPAQTTVALLAQVAQQLGVNDEMNDIAYGIDSSPQPFRASSVAVKVNRLWFASLALTMASAIFAMLAKQWIYEYTAGLTTNPKHSSKIRMKKEARLREFRFSGLERWYVQEIIGALPIILHVALLLFGVGLIELLWSFDPGSAIIMLVAVAGVFLAYIVTTIAPSYNPRSPYKTPLSHLLSNSRQAFRLILQPNMDTVDASGPFQRGIRQAFKVHGTLLEAEQKAIEKHESDLDKQCLERLRNTTRSESTAMWADSEIIALNSRDSTYDGRRSSLGLDVGHEGP